MAQSEPVVTLMTEGTIGTIVLNRPPVNSYDHKFLDDMDDAIRAAEANSQIRVLIVVSPLRMFSAGADVKFFSTATPSERDVLAEHGNQVFNRLANSRKPSIAVFNGDAYGGGLEIGLACDFRYAVEGAKLGLAEITLGMIPGTGGTQRLARIIGPVRAKRHMFFGQPFSLHDALSWGLVDEVCASGKLMEIVNAFAASLAERTPIAVGAIKVAVDEGIGLPLRDGLAVERRELGRVFRTNDANEGIAAFLEKRQPVWTGT